MRSLNPKINVLAIQKGTEVKNLLLVCIRLIATVGVVVSLVVSIEKEITDDEGNPSIPLVELSQVHILNLVDVNLLAVNLDASLVPYEVVNNPLPVCSYLTTRNQARMVFSSILQAISSVFRS